MMEHSLRSAAVLIGACCLIARANAEPAAQTQRAPSTAATNVPLAGQQGAQCAASTEAAADACGSLFGTMMEYQKALNKEQREDRKLQREDARRALEAKATKLKVSNQSIDQQMKESRERADTLEQQGGEATVAARPVQGVVQTRPPGGVGTTARLCRLPETSCPEPCKPLPCD
jgi:hypothetical protein